MAILTASTTHTQLPDQGISTTSPIFNDMDGRVAQIYQEYTDTKIGVRYYGTCTVTSLGNSYWLSNTHCFYSNNLSDEAVDTRIKSAMLYVGRPGQQEQSSIEELIFFPGVKEFTIDEYGKEWHLNDLVIFKTKHDIANGGFNLHTNGHSHPEGTSVRISGSDSNWKRDYPSAIDIPIEAEVSYDSTSNRVYMVYDSFSATCSGDSGGATYDNESKTLYGLPASDNSRAANQPCVEILEQKYISSYTAIDTPSNLAFINKHLGRLGDDKPTSPSTPDPVKVSGGSSLSSSR